jgi:hypothetical protein
MRVADLPDSGCPSAIERCGICGFAIWRALSSPRTDLLYCIQCAADRFGPEQKIEAPTAKQRKVVEAAIRRKRQ